jgi:hypothetical protein
LSDSGSSEPAPGAAGTRKAATSYEAARRVFDGGRDGRLPATAPYGVAVNPPKSRLAWLVGSQGCGWAGKWPALLRAVADGDGELNEKARGDLAELVIAGPGLWLGWLEDLQRDGLLGSCWMTA